MIEKETEKIEETQTHQNMNKTELRIFYRLNINTE